MADKTPMERWAAELRAAHSIAKGERLHELRTGRRPKTFDKRGIHPFSEVWGRIGLLASHPELIEALRENPDLEPSAPELRRAAEKEAMDEFIDEMVAARQEANLAPREGG